MRRARFLFWLDVALLLLLAPLEEPVTTGLAGHEWVSIAFAVLLALHLLVNWRWITAALGRYRTAPRRAQFNAWLNGTLYVLMVLTIFSGLMVSRFVVPALGLGASTLQLWHPLHTVIASVTLGVVGLHLALNWDWIVGALRQWRSRRRLASHRTLLERLGLDSMGRVGARFGWLLAVTAVVCGVSLLLVSAIASRPADISRLPNIPRADIGEAFGESSVQLLIIAVSALIGRTVLRIKL